MMEVILPVVVASEKVTAHQFSRNKKKMVFMVQNNLLSIISRAFHLYYWVSIPVEAIIKNKIANTNPSVK